MGCHIEFTDKSKWDMLKSQLEVNDSWFFGFGKNDRHFYVRLFGLEMLGWTSKS
jgi:hypothetical protein